MASMLSDVQKKFPRSIRLPKPGGGAGKKLKRVGGKLTPEEIQQRKDAAAASARARRKSGNPANPGRSVSRAEARRSRGGADMDGTKPKTFSSRIEEIKGQKPIKVKGADEALKLMAEGKHVELDPDLVGVFLEKLSALGKEAFEKGEDTPDYDLCRVHVKNHNIFCADNLGIVRDKMPQLGGKKVKPGSYADKKLKKQQADAQAKGAKVPDEVDIGDEFMAALKKSGVQITDEKVDASKLKATQSQLKGGQIGGMMAASTVKGGPLDLSKPIFVSRDNYILDGHHRWASLAALEMTEGQSLEMNVRRIDVPIQELVGLTNDFTQKMGVLPKSTVAKMLIEKRRRAGRGPNPKSTMKEIVGSHGHRSHGKSILWPALYEHLLAKGHTKSAAAAISNAGWKKKRMGIPTNTPMSAKGVLKGEPPCIGCGDDEDDDVIIMKTEDDKQLVFGWAYTTHDPRGQLVVDKSGDFIDDPQELEEAAYEFVLHSRQGGQDHARVGGGPVVKSKMVESVIFTPEKAEAMGIPQGVLPTGWWVGFKVDDPDLWADVKAEKYTSFSIHGTGMRKAVA